MKHLGLWMSGLAALLLVCGTALAEKKEAAAGGEKKVEGKVEAKGEHKGHGGAKLEGNYAIMASELKMTDEQKAKLDATLKECDGKIAAWKTENQAKLEQLKKDLAEARTAKDAEKVKSLSEQQKVLMDDQQKLEKAKREAVSALLTPEQKEAWSTYQIYTQVVGEFKKANLTDEQKAKVKEMAAPVAKQVAQIDAKDQKARGKALADLRSAVKAQVLTDEQRALLEKPKTEGEGKAKAKGEGAGEGKAKNKEGAGKAGEAKAGAAE